MKFSTTRKRLAQLSQQDSHGGDTGIKARYSPSRAYITTLIVIASRRYRWLLLNNEDPGLSTTSRNFFAFDVMDADLGFSEQLDGTNIRKLGQFISKSYSREFKACPKRSGIKY